MKMPEIIALIKQLAQSQGFYGRMLAALNELKINDPNGYQNLANNWESQNWTNPLDFILAIES